MNRISNDNIAPIVLFAYNRPKHLSLTLKALSENELAKQSCLHIFCDGEKEGITKEERTCIQDTRVIAETESKGKFCEVHLHFSEHNKGLADSIIEGVTQIVERYGKVIVLEDDIITSKGFLRYMNEGLNIYQYDDKVMHITGYMFPIKKKLPSTFFYEVPHCWGWGTWDRAWKKIILDQNFLFNYWKNHWDKFNSWGEADLQRQLTDNYTGKLKTWFIKWHASVLLYNGLSLWPNKSLVSNIGCDGSGTNCSNWHKFDTPEMAEYINIKRLNKIEENKKAYRIIKIFNFGHWYNKRRRKRTWKKISSIL